VNPVTCARAIAALLGPSVTLGRRSFQVAAEHAVVRFKDGDGDDEVAFRILPDGVLYQSWHGAWPVEREAAASLVREALTLARILTGAA
jgi:hypothetical protein